MAYTSKYPILHITVDTVVLAGPDDDLEVLLVRRGRDPFQGALALPGGFVEITEDLADAAVRELAEETGLQVDSSELRQVAAFGRPGRDPRQRTITIAHTVRLPEPVPVVGGDDAEDAVWVRVADARGLGFDHDEILAAALRHV